MNYRFAGTWNFEIVNNEIDEDNNCNFLCEDSIINVGSEINFDVEIKEFIIKNKDFTALSDGYYHCYFEGILWWEYNENYEYGVTDCDLWTNINYFNIIKME
jgi:hypothetical protein